MGKATVTLSRKNQITIPARVCRELGLKAGTRLSVDTQGSEIILTPRPASYRKLLGGKLAGVYGTAKEISAYLREERKSWKG